MKLSNLGLLRTQLTLSRQRLVQRRTYADHAVHTPVCPIFFFESSFELNSLLEANQNCLTHAQVTKSSDTPWVVRSNSIFISFARPFRLNLMTHTLNPTRSVPPPSLGPR